MLKSRSSEGDRKPPAPTPGEVAREEEAVEEGSKRLLLVRTHQAATTPAAATDKRAAFKGTLKRSPASAPYAQHAAASSSVLLSSFVPHDST